MLIQPHIARAAVFLACVPALCRAQDTTATCASCHQGEAKLLAGSAHAGWACQECHQGEATYLLSVQDADRHARRGQGAPLTFDHGASFAGQPARSAVPALCGDCHADVERMNPYGLRTDQLARYKTSGHGKALYERHDERVAVCTDCHGSPHEILAADDPESRTHPLNVPHMCGACHENRALMSEYDLAVEVVAEYLDSVHGRLLLEQHDTGAPTCATCHGNHSAMPPGFATVGAVCGQCHEQDARNFAASVHGDLEGFEGCVQCHGGGPGGHFHLVEPISEPTGLMIQRYTRLLASEPGPTPEQITAAIHPEPVAIIEQALPACMECHEDLAEDENLPKMFDLLEEIAAAERRYVRTARRLDEVGRGVLLVDSARFKFGDAKTHLIALVPLQHTLDESLIRETVTELNTVCDEVDGDLDKLEAGLGLRYRLLVPMWALALIFSGVLYVKFKKLEAVYVEPVGQPAGAPAPTKAGALEQPTRRTFLDWLIGGCSAAIGMAMGVPALLYLWPAAKGGAAAQVEVAGAGTLPPGQSTTIQVGGKAIIVVRHRAGFRAFAAACTHLGCLVTWDPSKREFLCPCHAAVFDENGEVVSGPPPSALPEYTVKEAGEQVFVSVS